MPTRSRTSRLVREIVEQIDLDLSGLVVLTEAATGHYALTAAIAAVGGAERIIAVTRDSAWGTAGDAVSATRTMIHACGARDNLTIVELPSPDILCVADVVTNLGFVRPINADRVAALKKTAVIALMCEPWEARPGDVDMLACAGRGVIVIGTDESTPSWPVFAYSGELSVKMLHNAGVEVFGLQIAVLGRDKFAPTIAKALRRAGASVQLDRRLTGTSSRSVVRGADVVLVADYASDEIIVGPAGLLTTRDLAELAPDASVIQFAGAVDEHDLRSAGFHVWPSPVVPSRRMSRTLADLGPKPLIMLHAAGLKVGEAAARLRLLGIPPLETVAQVRRDLAIALPVVPLAAGDS